MLKDIEGKHAVETAVSKWQLMGIAYDVGVFENLVLEFDAGWILPRSRTRSNVKDKAIAVAENFLEIRADRVRNVIGGNDDDLVIDEHWHFILQPVGDAARFALWLATPETQFAMAGGTTDNIGNALNHSTPNLSLL
jgi:hypothetical protein